MSARPRWTFAAGCGGLPRPARLPLQPQRGPRVPPEGRVVARGLPPDAAGRRRGAPRRRPRRLRLRLGARRRRARPAASGRGRRASSGTASPTSPASPPPAPSPASGSGWRPTTWCCMNVGTLEPRKNQVGLVDLFAHVSKEFPRARLLLAGDGPDRPAVEQQVREAGVEDRVKLLGMRSDVPALMSLADLYVHFAKVENCPVVLLEAARAGLPIAAVPVGGVPEVLGKIGSGVSLDAGDHPASLDVLRPLLMDAALRAESGHRARVGFSRHFTREAMVAAYLDLLRLSQPAGRARRGRREALGPANPGDGPGGDVRPSRRRARVPAAGRFLPPRPVDRPARLRPRRPRLRVPRRAAAVHRRGGAARGHPRPRCASRSSPESFGYRRPGRCWRGSGGASPARSPASALTAWTPCATAWSGATARSP